jgi:hypothetical protein
VHHRVFGGCSYTRRNRQTDVYEICCREGHGPLVVNWMVKDEGLRMMPPEEEE